MGIAGAGKTTVGRALATALGWPFHDADAFHSRANVLKMRTGAGLTDAEREPWLGALERLLERLAREGADAVLACSALKRGLRKRLRAAGRDVRFVHLTIDAETARRRLELRRGHYAGPSLLASQLHDLEPPEGAIEVDATPPVEEIVGSLAARLAGRGGP